MSKIDERSWREGFRIGKIRGIAEGKIMILDKLAKIIQQNTPGIAVLDKPEPPKGNG